MSIILTIIITHPEGTALYGNIDPEKRLKIEQYQKETSELTGFISESRTRLSSTTIEQVVIFDNMSNFQSYLLHEQDHPMRVERAQYNKQNNITGTRTVSDSETGQILFG